MLNEPRSPNIFDAVHITESKRLTPQGQEPSQNIYYFSKKLQSITQFMDFLECNPDDQTELTELQLRWERSFFKEELKAALFLNYTLIKLHCQVTDELKLVKKDMQNRMDRKKISQEFEKKLEQHAQLSENCQAHSNQTSSSKKRLVKDAFEAERKIMQAKHQRQCDDLKKMLHKVEGLLRVSKQENQYMRGELLEISEKNFALLNDNREAEDCKRKALEENKELRIRIEQLENKSYHETKLNRLNCSPINRSIEAFGQDEAEISFNHQFFNENIIENKLLKKQLEQLQFELDQANSKNAKLQGSYSSHEQEQHMDVMQESCRLFLVELEKEYLDVKKQLQANIAQVAKYQHIIKQMQAKNTENIVKSAEIDVVAAPKEDLCSICPMLSKENESLRTEKKKVQAKYQALRQKFDKTLSLQLIQRQQWDHFLKDLNAE